jgi:hypothetical protein
VCREPLGGQPDRCFRCETRLGPWWELEGALAESAAPAVAPQIPLARPRPSASLLAVAVAASLVLGLVAGFGLRAAPARGVVAAVESAPVGSAEPMATPALSQHSPAPIAERPTTASPRRVTYRAQRGDSLWRIAAAVTGDGRRWRELWPDRPSGQLVRHEVLVIPAVPEQE